MTTPYWIKPLIRMAYHQRYFWSRLTRNRHLGPLVYRMLFENDDMLYLPRDRVFEINEPADAGGVRSMPVPSKVLEHFIRQAGFLWMMDFCICRESSGCSDYPKNMGCLFMGEAARHINPGFGRQVSMEEALRHARRCREAGLVHLMGRNKLDALWLGTGPAQKLLTVCNCCPCCCLWRVLPEVDGRIGEKVSRMPGISVEVTDKCAGCGRCTRGICFVDAIRLRGEKAEIDRDLCRGCGRCAAACPNNAIEVRVNDPAFVENTIERIASSVDVR
ncbi:MAG: DUF362 domain-containing protein [Thermodesulfobacteriota bacterium]